METVFGYVSEAGVVQYAEYKGNFRGVHFFSCSLAAGSPRFHTALFCLASMQILTAASVCLSSIARIRRLSCYGKEGGLARKGAVRHLISDDQGLFKYSELAHVAGFSPGFLAKVTHCSLASDQAQTPF